MKSGLEGRNNGPSNESWNSLWLRLNEVRPRRPEQLLNAAASSGMYLVSQ